MPADVQIIVACIIAAFAAFMITLAGALVWTWSGDRRLPAKTPASTAQTPPELRRVA